MLLKTFFLKWGARLLDRLGSASGKCPARVLWWGSICVLPSLPWRWHAVDKNDLWLMGVRNGTSFRARTRGTDNDVCVASTAGHDLVRDQGMTERGNMVHSPSQKYVCFDDVQTPPHNLAGHLPLTAPNNLAGVPETQRPFFSSSTNILNGTGGSA